MAFPKRNAECAAEFLRRLLRVLPVLALLSDNGAEFPADFDRLGLRRFFIFPLLSQAERAKRALQQRPAAWLHSGQRAFRRLGLHVVGADGSRLDATYLAWLDVRGLSVENPPAHFEAHGLGMSPGEVFGDAGWMRLNFGCPPETLREIIRRFGNAAEKA